MNVLGEVQCCRVLARQGQRLLRRVHGKIPGIGTSGREAQYNAARPGANINNSRGFGLP